MLPDGTAKGAWGRLTVPDERGIRINATGQGCSTDPIFFCHFETATPLSYQKAQGILVSVKRYLAGPSLLKSRKRLILQVHRNVYELRDALLDERYRLDLKICPSRCYFPI